MPGIEPDAYRVVTEETMNAPWFGVPGGRLFRCWMCCKRFKVAEEYRLLVSRGPEGNCIICKECDGPTIEIQWANRYAFARENFFWMWKG